MEIDGTAFDRATDIRRPSYSPVVRGIPITPKKEVDSIPSWMIHAMCMLRYKEEPYIHSYTLEELAYAYLFAGCLKDHYCIDDSLHPVAMRRLAHYLDSNHHMLSGPMRMVLPKSALILNNPAHIPWVHCDIGRKMVDEVQEYLNHITKPVAA